MPKIKIFNKPEFLRILLIYFNYIDNDQTILVIISLLFFKMNVNFLIKEIMSYTKIHDIFLYFNSTNHKSELYKI